MSFIHNKDLQDLLYSIALTTETPICIHDDKFNIVQGFNSHFQTDFCFQMQQIPEFFEKCKQCDVESFKKVNKTKNLTIYKCHAGIIELTAPIINNGVICGYIMSGQVTDIKDRSEFIKLLLERCSPYADEETIKNLAKSIKYKSTEQIFAVAKLLDICANYIQLKQMVRPTEERLITLIDEYVENHLTEHISIKQLCNEFKTSRTQLYAAVSNHIQGGLAAYIKEKRLITAKKLLNTTDFSMTEISERVGFSDYNYFSKSFKKKYGMTPKKYKSTLKNKDLNK